MLMLSVAIFGRGWTLFGTAPIGVVAVYAASATDTEAASFVFCHNNGGTNCVVDGDTIWYRGTKIRPKRINRNARQRQNSVLRLLGGCFSW
jgi:micrococcal nuclease